MEQKGEEKLTQKLSQQEYDALIRKQFLNNVIFGSIQYQSKLLDLLYDKISSEIFKDYRSEIIVVNAKINDLLIVLNKELDNILKFNM